MSNQRGTIVSLWVCTAHRTAMQPREALRAIADLGLEGDLHAKQGSTRQVLLMDEETLMALGLSAGMVRENITTRGIELKTLAAGARLRAGTALLEVTQPCTPCDFMDGIRAGLRAQMQGQRGMLARVIEDGELRVGDAIKVVSKQALPR